MPHDHHHHHHHHHSTDKPLVWAVAINVILSFAQIIGGAFASSMALIADGVHNLSDAASLVLAFGARKLARRGASPSYSFGWSRAEVIAALVNFVTLIVISIWLAFEAIGRLAHPPEVAGGMVMALAGLALVINTATAALTWRLSKDSVNIRAAFLHNITDAGASVAVLLGGVLIWALGWYWADPVVTILISALILRHVAGDLPQVWRILMLGAPTHLDSETITARIVESKGVQDIHDLHLWQFDEHQSALQAHLVLTPTAEPAATLRQIKAQLAREFGLSNVVFEVETQASGCAGGAFAAPR